MLGALSACGGTAAPPTSTTTTTSPAALQAGQKVCQGFYAELFDTQRARVPIDFRSRVEPAKRAGPQLGQIFEGLAQLSAEKEAGATPDADLADRTRTLLASLEVVCQDSYGVAPPNTLGTAPGP